MIKQEISFSTISYIKILLGLRIVRELGACRALTVTTSLVNSSTVSQDMLKATSADASKI